jgi:hypothetical protein
MMVNEVEVLKSERERIPAQLAEVRVAERELKQRLGDRIPNFDPLVGVYARRTALDKNLRSLDSEIADTAGPHTHTQ